MKKRAKKTDSTSKKVEEVEEKTTSEKVEEKTTSERIEKKTASKDFEIENRISFLFLDKKTKKHRHRNTETISNDRHSISKIIFFDR